MLEAVYAAGSKAEERTKAQMRMTLKANLARNLKKSDERDAAPGGRFHRRGMSTTVPDTKAAWKESSDLIASKPTMEGSMV